MMQFWATNVIRRQEGYTPNMDRVEEIEAAISSLAPEEYRRLLEWFREPLVGSGPTAR